MAALIVTLQMPGDKSISHRALLVAALSQGDTRIDGLLIAEDVYATYRSIRALGVACSPFAPSVVVHGRGPAALRSPTDSIDCGNSGTTARLLAGIIGGCEGVGATFVGDASLSRRPMRRVADPLRTMGAMVTLSAHDTLPMHVQGAALHGVAHVSPVASGQVKSAVLLAAVASGCAASVHEPGASRDHTERMLQSRGVPVWQQIDERGVVTQVGAVQSVSARSVRVPGDPSAAVVLAALAVLSDGVTLSLPGVSVNPTRLGGVRLLQRMGASITVTPAHDAPHEGESGDEPVGDLLVRGSMLRGITITGDEVPQAVDELVVLACVAARARGTTVIEGAAELRVKESDRIGLTVRNMRAIGVDAHERSDGLVVHGSTTPLHGVVHTEGDHRQAMAFGMLGALPGNVISIDNRACVAVSYPTFWDDVRRLHDASHSADTSPRFQQPRV